MSLHQPKKRNQWLVFRRCGFQTCEAAKISLVCCAKLFFTRRNPPGKTLRSDQSFEGLAVLRCLLWWQVVVGGACWPQTEHPTLNPLCKVFVPSPTSVWKVAVLAYSVVHWWRCYPRHLVLRRSERILVGYSRDPIKPRNVCAKYRLLLTKATL